MKRIAGAWAGITGALAVGYAPAAWGCEALQIEGAPPIKVNAEAAIIVWDAAHHTEHFIRRATFDSSGKSMGFLVPTPNTPAISAASDGIFNSLDNALEPRTNTRIRTGYRFDWLLLPDAPEPARRASFQPAIEAPRALQQNKRSSVGTAAVGGYTATILPARNEPELERWMRQHKFKTDAGTRAWLKPYIDRGWTITAFSIRPGKNATALTPVRLSFKTDKPYYPYREPATARAKGKFAKDRTLKVYYVAKQRVDGGIGRTTAWPGEVEWSAALPASGRADLMRGSALGTSQIPPQARLTVFEDDASPRPGTDEVFFRPSPDQGKIMPEPTEQWSEGRTKIPLEFFVLGLVGGSIWAMKRTNRYFGRRKTRVQG